jgi:hypothetical protein
MLGLSTRSLRQSGSASFCWRTMIANERPYRSTFACFLSDDAAVDVDVKKLKEEALQKKLEAKLSARDYNNRRAAYKRQVSVLRREYADQIAKQRAADVAEEEDRQQKLVRQKLERQRLKNMKIAASAIREEEFRQQREREFEEHLVKQQQIRDAKNERYTAARQMVIDELEKEAHLWLTTPEEVELAFSSPDNEQLLWTRPRGILGAPNPSLDSHFWQYETHTWDMSKTYKSQRQALLEEIEDMAYDEANINKKFWTPERILEHERLEEKAKLRAMVYSVGRAELLKKQRELIQNDSKNDIIPTAEKVPSLNLLNNDTAIEREGANVLMNDPTKFFIFDNNAINSTTGSANMSAYAGPTLGAPIALRDLLRDGPSGTVFPEIIGKNPKPDTRSEREKKQAEREEKMWAAAQAQAQKELDAAGGGASVDEEDDDDKGPALDYDAIDANDSDHEEWVRGLDPETDMEVIETPREHRYKEDDIDWILNKLDDKMKFLNQQFAQDVEIIKEEMKSELRKKSAAQQAPEAAGDHSGSQNETIEGTLETALLALPEKQLMALSDLEETYEPGKMPDYELAAAIKEIPGLTEEQIMMILTRDRSI